MTNRALTISAVIILLLAIGGAGVIWFNIKNYNIPETDLPKESEDVPIVGFPVSKPLIGEPEIIETADPNLISSSSTQITQPTNLEEAGQNPTKIAVGPIAGYLVLPPDNKNASSTIFVWDSKSNNLLMIARGETRPLTDNSNLGTIARSWIKKDGDRLLFVGQYLDSREQPITFWSINSFPQLTSTSTINLALNLIPNVKGNGVSLSPSPDNSEIFYLTDTPNGTQGRILNPNTGVTKNVFSSPLKSWSATWISKEIISLIPAASNQATGILYFLNPNNQKLNPILGPMTGFTTSISPTGKKIIYNQGFGNLKLYSIKNESTESLVISTITDKCVWAPDSIILYCAVPKFNQSTNLQYPDAWWSGESSFEDDFWKIDTETKEATIIWSKQNQSNSISYDAVDLTLNEAENKLYFINRSDFSLWSLDF